MDESSSRGHSGSNGILRNYRLGRVIGTGTFAKVKRAVHISTGIKVAVKILNLKKMKEQKVDEKGMCHLLLSSFLMPRMFMYSDGCSNKTRNPDMETT